MMPRTIRIPNEMGRKAAGWLCAVLFFAVPVATVSAQSVWELTPYRIRLITAMQPAPGLGERLQDDLHAALSSQFETVIGAAWDVSIERASPRLGNRMTAEMASVTAEMLPADSAAFDKIMLLAVSAGPRGFKVCVREFDVRTQVLGRIVELPAAQASKLRDVSLRAVWQAFTPLARIAESKGKEATLRLRAGGLSVRDKALAGTAVGDVFRPFVRYIDREGKLRRVVDVPWTFLVVEQFEPRKLKCKLYSAMIAPLSGRRRGRVEQLALAVRPRQDSTRLVLCDRIEPRRPLFGYEVFAREPESKEETLLGRTDAHGAVEVAAVKENPLRILLVKCGDVLLARLPVVPGLVQSLTAEVPAVDKLIEVEGFITGLQEELIDLVTRREVLVIRARKHIEAADWERARAAVDELLSLKTRAEFARTLDREQEKVAVKDTWTKKKIEILFDDTRKLLNRFLDPETVEEIAGELAGARENR